MGDGYNEALGDGYNAALGDGYNAAFRERVLGGCGRRV